MIAKTVGPIFLILAISLFSFGRYLSSELTDGENQITQIEENLSDRGRPTIGPIRRNIRAQAAESKGEKIEEARAKISKSKTEAVWLQGAGIAFFILGVAFSASYFYNQKRER